MSVQLMVKGGPDAGRTYSLPMGVTNVGRGPNAQIRLSDPSMQGTIAVETAGGVVRVRHDLPHQIYLNRQPFPSGESRTWFHGHELQPTADTVLVMLLSGDKVEGPEKPKTGQMILTGGLVVVAAVIFMMPTDEDGAKTADAAETANVDKPSAVQAGLLKLATAHPNDRTLITLPKLFAAARADELRQRTKGAFESYSQFRDALLLAENAPRRASEMLTPDEAAAMASAKRYVNASLIKLSPRKSSDL